MTDKVSSAYRIIIIIIIVNGQNICIYLYYKYIFHFLHNDITFTHNKLLLMDSGLYHTKLMTIDNLRDVVIAHRGTEAVIGQDGNN